MLEMSEKKSIRDEVRREAKEALDAMRKDLQQLSRDLVVASKTLKTSTEKFVEDTGPKVSAGLEETVETFRRTMTAIDKQTKPQQARLLRTYQKFLTKQVDFIEKRLKQTE
jgi:phosphoenolpyruvate carboxylase